MIFSPLDQFKIASFIPLQVIGVDLSVTNFLVTSFLTLLVFQSFALMIKSPRNHSFFIIPSGWQNLIEKMYGIVIQLLLDILLIGNEKYFQTATVLFMFILTNNLIGMVPYSFTITSHIILTFFLSFSIFGAINIIGFKKHGLEFFSLFLPSNTGFFLALILVPIELISFIAKPVSLGVRLFINLMAGHSLLKVIVGFSWNMLLLENFKAIAFLIPFLLLIVLMGLELGVALIQSFVFLILTVIYLNDSESLH